MRIEARSAGADPPIIERTVALMAMPCAAPAMAEQIRNGTTVPATSAASSPSNASVKAIMPSRCAAAAANRPPIGVPMMLGAMYGGDNQRHDNGIRRMELNGDTTTWLEPVTDEQYAAAHRALDS